MEPEYIDKVSLDSKMDKKSSRLITLSIMLFTISFIYGLIRMTDSSYQQQAILIMLESALGAAFMCLPLLLFYKFKIEMTFYLVVPLSLFLIMSIIVGEVFEFYYRYRGWDSMLHAFSGYGIALLAYALLDYLLKDVEIKHRHAFLLIGALALSFTVGMIWELLEYIIDSLFGTNMQKFMPIDPRFFNGGKTNEPLLGTNEEIANFFRSPEGYRYALRDTMKDIVFCALGNLGFVAVTQVIRRKNEFAYQNGFAKLSN